MKHKVTRADGPKRGRKFRRSADDPRLLEFVRADETRKAARALMEAFPWARTKEGSRFWLKVHARLASIAIAAGARQKVRGSDGC